MLAWKNGSRDTLTIEGRVVDPTERIDACLRLTIEDGLIAQIESGAAANGHVIAPAFVDPHVHLRTPGRPASPTTACPSSRRG